MHKYYKIIEWPADKVISINKYDCVSIGTLGEIIKISVSQKVNDKEITLELKWVGLSYSAIL